MSVSRAAVKQNRVPGVGRSKYSARAGPRAGKMVVAELAVRGDCTEGQVEFGRSERQRRGSGC